MKVKSVKRNILEKVGFLLPPRKLLSAKDKVGIMEQFLMMPMSKIRSLQQDVGQPSFVQQITILLYNDNLREYFDVLKMCREMAREEKQGKDGFLE